MTKFRQDVQKAGWKFIGWELFWTVRFLSAKKLINMAKGFYQANISQAARLSSFPLKLTIDPTDVCNLRCPLCPTGQDNPLRNKGMLKLSQLQKLIAEVGDYLFEVDLFDWGEPFLNRSIFEIIRTCQQKGIKTRISSNMNIFPEGYEKLLVESKLHHLVVSLDGTSQESYQKYRVGGSIEKVVEAVKRIAAEKKKQKSNHPFLTWQFIVMPQNENEMAEADELYRPWGFDRLVFRKNRGDMGQELFESDEKKVENYGSWIPKTANVTNFDVVNKRRKTQPDTCHRPWTEAVVNWDGSVSPCCLYYDQSFDFGNAFQTNFKDIWNNERYQEARKLITTRNSKGKSLICWNCIRNGFPD